MDETSLNWKTAMAPILTGCIESLDPKRK